MKSRDWTWPKITLLLVLAAGTLALLLVLTTQPPELGPTVIFVALVLFASIWSIPSAAGTVSLAHMVMAAAMLALGPVPAGWVAYLTAILFDLWRSQTVPRMRQPNYLLATMFQNITMQPLSVLAAGAVFLGLGGRTPCIGLPADQVLPLLAALVTYIAVNNAIFIGFSWLRAADPLILYRQQGWHVVLIEASPLIFSPLVAVIFTQLGFPFFFLFSLILGTMVIITKRLATTLQALERRARTLDTLNVVGRALSANLRLDALLAAVHSQVGRLMDASTLYVALYDPVTEEIHFPLAIEDGQVARYLPRPMGNGLTEYVIRTRRPLLLTGDVAARAQDMGVQIVLQGRPAAAWLGVPLMAGEEVLGVLAVQSATRSSAAAYDEHDQETLTTIAGQTATAITNARLYERADLALERRVHELSAVLDTSRDGILLLDPAGRVLMTNPALARFWSTPVSALTGLSIYGQHLPDGRPLLSALGYTEKTLKADLEQAQREPGMYLTAVIELDPPYPNAFVRTLTAVQTEHDTTSGWLIILRDASEEQKLARMREDLSSMIVHDLRSPLTGILGGISMLQESPNRYSIGEQKMLAIIEASGRKMLDMVSSLLDISRMETGRMPLEIIPVPISLVTESAIAQLDPIAQRANVQLLLELPADLSPAAADAEKLGRVMVNLVDNAINYTPAEGEVTIWARNNGGEVLVGVHDTGPGIPAEEQTRIFEKFGQVRGRRGRRKGSGLGLAFCKLAVEAMGGRIWLESEMGRGSTFMLALPTAEGTSVS